MAACGKLVHLALAASLPLAWLLWRQIRRAREANPPTKQAVEDKVHSATTSRSIELSVGCDERALSAPEIGTADASWDAFLGERQMYGPGEASRLSATLQRFLDAADRQRLGAPSSTPNQADISSEGMVGANYLLNARCRGVWATPLLYAVSQRDDLLASAILSLSPERYAVHVDVVAEGTDTTFNGIDALSIALCPPVSSPAVICALIDRTCNLNRGAGPGIPSASDGRWRANCTPLALAVFSGHTEAILYILRARWMDFDFGAPCGDIPRSWRARVWPYQPLWRCPSRPTPWQMLFASSFKASLEVATSWNRALASVCQLRSACARLLNDSHGIPPELVNIILDYMILNKPGSISLAPHDLCLDAPGSWTLRVA